MPRKETLYTCEICERQYSMEEDASKCEMNHTPVVFIKSQNYMAGTKDVDSLIYPISLVVEFGNGKTKTYYRSALSN